MFKQIIVIAGVARSGTSWLGEVVNSSPDVAYRFQPLFSYAFKDAVNEDSSKYEYENFFIKIYKSNDNFLTQKDKRDSGLYPIFNKKDLPENLAFKTCRYQYLLSKMIYYFNNLKIVGIVRHPCGAINSWIKNPKEFPRDANPLKEWRFGSCKNKGRPEEFFGYYKWKEIANIYLDLHEKYPNQFYLLKYEDLVFKSIIKSQEIFKFLGLEYTDQTKSFLESSKSVHMEDPFAVFKDNSVTTRWKNELDSYIVEEIVNDLKGTRLAKFLI